MLQIARPSQEMKSNQPSNYAKYLAMSSNIKTKIDKNQRRHSAFDLVNRTDLAQDIQHNKPPQVKEKSKFKIKQSESYSFDMNNRLYSK